MRRLRLAPLLAVCLGIFPLPAAAEEPAAQPAAPTAPRTPEDVAARVLAAQRTGDASTLDSLARGLDPSPFLVADVLLARVAPGAAAEAVADGTTWAALRAWAARWKGRPEGDGMAACVETWSEWTAHEHRLEKAAREVLSRAVAVRSASQLLGSRDLVRAAADTVAPVVLSLAAPRLFLLTAEIELEQAALISSALLAEVAEAKSRLLTWTSLQGVAFSVQVQAHDRRQDYPRLETAAQGWLVCASALGRAEDRWSARQALAWSLQGRGRWSEALELMSALEADPVALAAPTLRARALQRMGDLLGYLGRDAEAVAAFDRSADLYTQARDEDGVSRTRERRAEFLKMRGEHAAALALLEESLVRYRLRGQRSLIGGVQAKIGGVREILAQSELALACYREALEIARGDGARGVEADLLRKIGSVEATLGRVAEGLAACQQALALYKSLGNVRKQGEAERELARLLIAAGRAQEALDLLAPHPGLDDASAPLTRRWRVADLRAGALHALGRLDEAAMLLERLAAERARGGFPPRPLTQRLLAKVNLARGDPHRALASSLAGLEQRMAISRGFGDDESQDVRELVHSDADLALKAALAVDALPGPSPTADSGALRALEASRARWLGEELALGPALAAAQVPADLIAAEEDSRRAAENAQRDLLAATFGRQPDEAAALRHRAALESAQVAWRDARARIGRAVRRAAHLVPLEPPDDAAALARTLPEGTVLVLYHLGHEQATGLALRGGAGGGVRLAALGPAADLAQRASAWHALLAAPGAPEEELSASLGEQLLAPFADLVRGAARVLVSPDGGLAFAPFEALRWAAPGGVRRLVETHEVGYVPSASVLALLEAQRQGEPPGRGLVALGDPVYPSEKSAPPGALRGLGDLARLPGTGREAEEVAALFPAGTATVLLREKATLAGLRAALASAPRWRAVHLACHGFFDPDLPRFSGVVLGGGEVLGLAQTARLPVPADLVVLSACETGQGTLRSGEGVEGLVRGLFLAGTPRVVVSDWRVADGSTRALMRDFYGAWQKEGRTPAAALRHAKLEALASKDRVHPFHWAAFVLWGLPD